MKYEKSIFIFIVVVCLCSCRSTRVSDNGNGIEQARNDLSELQKEQQSTTERLEAVADGLGNLESEITDGLTTSQERLGEVTDSLEERTDEIGEFENILRRVRERKVIYPAGE